MRFRSFAVTAALDLSSVSRYLGLSARPDWSGSLYLGPRSLQQILLKQSDHLHAWVFSFGSVVVSNFSDPDIRAFLAFLEGFLPHSTDWTLFGRTAEEQDIVFSDDRIYLLQEPTVQDPQKFVPPEHMSAIAEVMAKASVLTQIEFQADTLLDTADTLIHRMLAGQLRHRQKKNTAVILEISRFQLLLAGNLRLFDQDRSGKESVRMTRDILACQFELSDRLIQLEQKLNNLSSLAKKYALSGNQLTERNLLVFEIVLLALFPVFSLATHFFGLLILHAP